MNTDDINLAYKVRHALNEQLDTLPDADSDSGLACQIRVDERLERAVFKLEGGE